MSTIEIILTAVISVSILIILPFVISKQIFKIFARRNGLERLIELFSTKQLESKLTFTRQTIGLGKVGYRNSSDICILPEGLYLWIRSFLTKYKPVLIPWNLLRNPQPKILFLRSAMELTIGNPVITTLRLNMVIFNQIKPFINNDTA